MVDEKTHLGGQVPLLRIHREDLVFGQGKFIEHRHQFAALQLELERLRVEHDEVTGDVVECAIAPGRWAERNEATRAGVGAAVRSVLMGLAT